MTTDPTGQPPAHTVADPDAIRAVRARLGRAQGQIGGVLAMLDDGRSCQDVVTQLAAASKAIDRAAFLLIATGLKECLSDGEEDAEAVAAQLQKLFLTMA
ncbi:MAG: metal-sensitive transcriptional regulator [Intrasporangiaceae bacterium]|nr:metal-sensitive transcriptional regulator [Intrasporangiaceae bacterium]